MSIDAAAFKKGMRHLAASVTLITTRHRDLRGGLTATAVCSDQSGTAGKSGKNSVSLSPRAHAEVSSAPAHAQRRKKN